MPTITDPVTIDGYSQSGSSANALANRDNAVIWIELSGATIGNNGNGLVIDGGGDVSVGSGLVMDNGWSLGIQILAKNVVVTGCFLGTDLILNCPANPRGSESSDHRWN